MAVSEDSLILFHNAPNVLWEEMSGSENRWMMEEILLDVSGADNVFASTPRNGSIELPPLSDTDFSIDFRIYSPDIVSVADNGGLNCCLEGSGEAGADSTQVEDDAVAVVEDYGVMVMEGMDIDWGGDINVEDLPDYF